MDFFQELLAIITDTGVLGVVVGVALLVVAVPIMGMFIIGFAQGRSVTFWPPKIGEKPAIRAELKSIEQIGNPSELASIDVSKGDRFVSSDGLEYLVKSTVYTGAYSSIFKAQSETQEIVAVKIYWRGMKPNSTVWQQFEREHRVVESLTHRNILQVSGKGLRGGYPFLVTEYMAGGTLRDLLQSRSRLPGRQIMSIASQLADGLDYAHSQGVLHLDVKPGNILFESNVNGRIALGDFGIATMFEDQEKDMTRLSPGFIGSPGYMAPEMMALDFGLGESSADIYSFGIVLYEMISGTIPFYSDQGVFALLASKRELDVSDIRSVRADVPPEVAERLLLTLSKDVEIRPISARSVISGLETMIDNL